jgi:deoxyribonuclease V
MKITHPELALARSLDEALAVQETVRGLTRLAPFQRHPHRVVGVDAAYAPDGVLGFAAAVALNVETLIRIEVQTAVTACTFPYVPGLFAFRELPILLGALRKLTDDPDVLLVEGHGVAHPRRAGLATHLGVLLDVPAIGCAKTPLGGEWQEPERRAGAWSEVRMDGEALGIAFRPRPENAPVFLSPGHQVDLASIQELAPRLFHGHRLPEPLHLAHETAEKIRRRH